MCTDLVVVSKTRDGRNLVVNARSQEFDQRVGYRLILRKQGEMVQVTMPAKKNTKEEALQQPELVDLCISKHNYAGVMMTTLTDRGPGIPISTATFDGMNDAGLSAGSLLFPGSQYQSPQAEADNVFVGFFVDWLLSNFDSCAAVKAVFGKNRLRVVAENAAEFPSDKVEETLGQHFAVHDASGNSLVIEFIDGQAQISGNPVGVLTNLPALSWQLTNLGLYAQLSNYDTSSDVAFGPLVYATPGTPSPRPLEKAVEDRSTGIPGRGNGLAGLPGDFRPASRFVRTAYLKHFAVPPESNEEAVSQAFHLLNAVDIVQGAMAEHVEKKTAHHWYSSLLKSKEPHDVNYDTAQCVVVKDLVNKVFYIRMYESPLPYSIAFKDFARFAPDGDVSKGVQITIPIGPDESLARPLRPQDVYAATEPATDREHGAAVLV